MRKREFREANPPNIGISVVTCAFPYLGPKFGFVKLDAPAAVDIIYQIRGREVEKSVLFLFPLLFIAPLLIPRPNSAH
jgi:hypothetical protein